MKNLTPNGVFGEPLKFSSEKGRKITEIVVENLKKIVLDLFESS
jgi:creatinine amidohydrolase/Fe(II)-dependent formamide hydrolase-like protein